MSFTSFRFIRLFIVRHFSFCSVLKILVAFATCSTVENALREALRSWGHYAHSLGYVRHYDFICHHAAHRYFPRFLTGSPCFGLPLRYCFSCSLKEPEQSSCRLYAVRCVTSYQVAVTLRLSRSPPSRFYRSKGYFTHLWLIFLWCS